MPLNRFMKTSKNFDMEAPNKLFIKPEKIKVEMIPGGELPNVGIQYIRKDFLLEPLKKKRDRVAEPPASPLDKGAIWILDGLIDKISSL